jgi:malyl-CoA/(S)-citramalyl-CoA lyase
MKTQRSVLSVPGHVTKMHSKAATSAADVIMLDLEDSVPPEAKEEARVKALSSLTSIDWGGKAVAVRINGIDTPFAYRDLLEIVEGAGGLISSLVVPKVNNAGDIHFVERMLDGMEMAKDIAQPIAIEASIETAQGLAEACAIASASRRLRSLVFGIADYAASVGARLVSLSGHGENEADIYPGHRWHFALSRMIMAAKAAGLSAIDAPYGFFKDPEGLARSSRMACALGCDGKWAIHPDQIDTINRTFSPSPADIARATAILAAAGEGVRQLRGAVAVDGRMIDQATVRLARQLYEQAEHLGLLVEKD